MTVIVCVCRRVCVSVSVCVPVTLMSRIRVSHAHIPRLRSLLFPFTHAPRHTQITRLYAQQTSSLEALAHPALDALMRNCNSVNLERVRKIKTQHQRLQGRLQGLREVMERYMGA